MLCSSHKLGFPFPHSKPKSNHLCTVNNWLQFSHIFSTLRFSNGMNCIDLLLLRKMYPLNSLHKSDVNFNRDIPRYTALESNSLTLINRQHIHHILGSGLHNPHTDYLSIYSDYYTSSRIVSSRGAPNHTDIHTHLCRRFKNSLLHLDTSHTYQLTNTSNTIQCIPCKCCLQGLGRSHLDIRDRGSIGHHTMHNSYQHMGYTFLARDLGCKITRI